MKRHPSRRRSGIAVPAFLCLLFAAVLLLGSRAGGDAFAQKILGKLAQNETFVSGAFALGTGQYPGETSVHAPRTATAGLEQEPTDEDLAELDMAMENAGLEPQAPASSEPQEIPEVKVNNQSGLDFDLNAMLQNSKTITADDDGPQVLVYHTHATEAYTPSGSDTYEASGDARTLDTNPVSYTHLRTGQVGAAQAFEIPRIAVQQPAQEQKHHSRRQQRPPDE